MKLNLSDEWCLAAANRESDQEVGVGFVAFDQFVSKSIKAESLIDKTIKTMHLAFGRFVNLLRR